MSAIQSSDANVVAEVSDLRVEFPGRDGSVQAVRGVDLTIRAGEVVGLVGESGSGKSVLSLALQGLLPDHAAVSGSIVLGGTEVVGASEPVLRRLRKSTVGAVFQDPMSSLNPTMRIGEQVREVAGTKDEVVTLLESCGIADARRRLRQYPHELSGGLRQRVMIAIAVAGSPRLIIADEPTTALDVTVQAQIIELFRSICAELGCAVLLVTHDLAVASSIADRTYVMYAGRAVEAGASDEVVSRPRHPYTAALVGARISMTSDRMRKLPTLGGEPPNARIDPVGCSFAPRCSRAEDICSTERPLLTMAPTHEGSAACHFSEHVAATDIVTTPWTATARPKGGLDVRGVSVSFPDRQGVFVRSRTSVLHDIDLVVAPGESLALVGESGSGKSTLLRAIAGLQPTSTGTIAVSGGTPQMVFQDAGSSLTPWLTVGELLRERLQGTPPTEREDRIQYTMTRLGLTSGTTKLRPGQLSGGQRQRVAIARAVIDPPELILCDEPISALDTTLAATVLNLLGELRRELGFSMVFVTHDLSAARLVSDRIVVMSAGELVEDGPADEVLRAPKHEYTQRLVAAIPQIKGAAA